MNTVSPISIALSPHGKLHALSGDIAHKDKTPLQEAFEKGSGYGLLWLARQEAVSDPVFSYWRNLACLFLSRICSLPDDGTSGFQVVAPVDEFQAVALAPPFMNGAEYLSAAVLTSLWEEMTLAFRHQAQQVGAGIRKCIETYYPRWHVVGRACLHLAENKSDPEAPFAFLATYTTRLSANAKAQHLPLGKALEQYGQTKDRSTLLNLLMPLQRATEQSSFLKKLVESGDIYHPLAWTPSEAYLFLKDIPVFETSGIMVRVPDWWKAKQPVRPQVSVNVGNSKSSALGIDAMLDFSVSLTLEGEPLSADECAQLLSATDGLHLIRGRWVELDANKLKEVLEHWQMVKRAAGETGLSFIEGMRLLSGSFVDGRLAPPADATVWSRIEAGKWLGEILNGLRNPEKLANLNLGKALKTELRPYQEIGVKWLWFLSQLRLGACLADDMGLGKTVQIIALLLILKNDQAQPVEPSLLVVPASLIANWKSEIERFAPSLDVSIAHPSAVSASQLREGRQDLIRNKDVVLTTYGTLLRISWFTEIQWKAVVLDEAQAIKNPGTKQTRAVKGLKSQARFALTGTPIENRLSDLWSLFDFLSPGLLGSAKAFSGFSKKLLSSGDNAYGPLRQLIRPYILRRLKTDKAVIADLPDKTEMRSYCLLSKLQAALYAQAVGTMAKEIKSVDGIKRRGIILSFLMRFKQICNHPSHWLGDGNYEPTHSGKFVRLREICEEISAKQEKVLVFTQFREITGPLAGFLQTVFNRPGLVLHGNVAVKKRKEMVDLFQDELGPPFFILSLKAGGTGLNLTQASHVIHFDRWWNPAVENQATDRAFRIGQKKNVLVHKFVCRGTVEDKIDKLMESKQGMAREILEDGSEKLITEMSNEELMELVSLDLNQALDES
ncbi:MAG: DEAD/DEAH box helicase [Deltaproteobacteria bacterium]|nr:DEAD/DEAH box helicase [Deltaproteobacteria bacterium]